MRAPIPRNERERLKALRRYRILDTVPETSYDDITLLAAEVCDAPIAAISLVDEDRQWFKSVVGLDVRQTSRDEAFCAHAILNGTEPLVVEDATRDERFADNALVLGDPSIRFYAGTPLVSGDGHALGTLCVIDRVPRGLSERQRKALSVLGREVVAQLELRRTVHQLSRTILDLKRAEAELTRSQREQMELKDQLISHVSHELRSPLTPIYQFVTVLLEGLAGPLADQQREYLEIVLQSAEQLRGLINDLLEVARAQTGKLSVDRRRIRVGGIIEETVRSLEATARAEDLALRAELGGGLPEAVGDAQRVRQILTNLVENAIKFTPGGGTITVRAEVRAEEPGAIRLTVEDTGCGIAPADCERIFEHLYQGPDHLTRSRNGLGLGLYISRELVARQGGRIWVESDQGRGSRFSFTLPVFALAPLIEPILTPEHVRRGSVALITVDLVRPGDGPGLDRDGEAMTAAWNQVCTCIHPAMDVVLPRFGSSERGETFLIVAMADAIGAGVICRRVEEQLRGCAQVLDAGYEWRVASTLLALPATDRAPHEAIGLRVARMIEAQMDETCSVDAG